jgi:hypothetical protein
VLLCNARQLATAAVHVRPDQPAKRRTHTRAEQRTDLLVARHDIAQDRAGDDTRRDPDIAGIV